MFAKRIIPCLDIDKGRVVKGIKFLSLRDAGDPVTQARAYEQQKADELVFLDITASHERRRTMIEISEKVASCVFIPFTVGGGIRSLLDIRNLLKTGCDKISINTTALNDPGFIKTASQRYGSQCIVVAIDAKKERPGFWRVYTHGGRHPTKWNAPEWAQYAEKCGAGEILLTSMDCDGTQDGYELELTRKVSQAVKIPVIASGGAGKLSHLCDAFTKGQADACLAASIFHFGTFKIPQSKAYLKRHGIPVRL